MFCNVKHSLTHLSSAKKVKVSLVVGNAISELLKLLALSVWVSLKYFTWMNWILVYKITVLNY